jgi:exportin-2 (importin alpha re-exporter)
MEQFEDEEPLEYTRISLRSSSASSSSIGEVTTRRQVAANVLQALIASGYEAETTVVVEGWVGPGEGSCCRRKRECVEGEGYSDLFSTAAVSWFFISFSFFSLFLSLHMLTSPIAARRNNVVKFSSEHVYPDLVAANDVLPMLRLRSLSEGFWRL